MVLVERRVYTLAVFLIPCNIHAAWKTPEAEAESAITPSVIVVGRL